MRGCVVTVSVCALLAIHSGAYCWEKGFAARNADVVVQGQMIDGWSFPWFDGWHFRGTLRVSRTLWGPVKAGEKLDYRFVTNIGGIWHRPNWNPYLRVEKLWFLRSAGPGIWQTAGVPSQDPGMVDIDDVAYYEKILSIRKAELLSHRR
jgi:hypothetical protein